MKRDWRMMVEAEAAGNEFWIYFKRIVLRLAEDGMWGVREKEESKNAVFELNKEWPFTDLMNVMDANSHGCFRLESRFQFRTCKAWDTF